MNKIDKEFVREMQIGLLKKGLKPEVVLTESTEVKILKAAYKKLKEGWHERKNDLKIKATEVKDKWNSLNQGQKKKAKVSAAVGTAAVAGLTGYALWKLKKKKCMKKCIESGAAKEACVKKC